jgi:glutathione synthase/RimK-type ligase-like ATP-grasp enzyme
MTVDDILIISPSDDIHSQSVKKTIENRATIDVHIWDSGDIPSTSQLVYKIGKDRPQTVIKFPDKSIKLNSLRSIWWRRPSPHKIDSDVSDSKIRSFCIRESDRGFRGSMLAANIPIINDPVAESTADLKPLQLSTANEVGLSIPRTVITNDPTEVRMFCQEINKDCIYKPLSPAPRSLAETRVLKERDLEYLELLRYAPIIVQEKIEKGRDIRATVIGDEVYAATVETTTAEASLDWRVDMTAEWHEWDLPQHVEQKLSNLLNILNLNYGCIDLRQTPDGEYIFFEINPSGQFLFIEVDTEQPILNSFAKMLIGNE